MDQPWPGSPLSMGCDEVHLTSPVSLRSPSSLDELSMYYMWLSTAAAPATPVGLGTSAAAAAGEQQSPESPLLSGVSPDDHAAPGEPRAAPNVHLHLHQHHHQHPSAPAAPSRPPPTALVRQPGVVFCSESLATRDPDDAFERRLAAVASALPLQEQREAARAPPPLVLQGPYPALRPARVGSSIPFVHCATEAWPKGRIGRKFYREAYKIPPYAEAWGIRIMLSSGHGGFIGKSYSLWSDNPGGHIVITLEHILEMLRASALPAPVRSCAERLLRDQYEIRGASSSPIARLALDCRQNLFAKGDSRKNNVRIAGKPGKPRLYDCLPGDSASGSAGPFFNLLDANTYKSFVKSLFTASGDCTPGSDKRSVLLAAGMTVIPLMAAAPAPRPEPGTGAPSPAPPPFVEAVGTRMTEKLLSLNSVFNNLLNLEVTPEWTLGFLCDYGEELARDEGEDHTAAQSGQDLTPTTSEFLRSVGGVKRRTDAVDTPKKRATIDVHTDDELTELFKKDKAVLLEQLRAHLAGPAREGCFVVEATAKSVMRCYRPRVSSRRRRKEVPFQNLVYRILKQTDFNLRTPLVKAVPSCVHCGPAALKRCRELGLHMRGVCIHPGHYRPGP